MTRSVELLWFSDCPHHEAARRLLGDVLADVAPATAIRDLDATDPSVAAALRFPGSPTIRVDGRDVEPGYVDPGVYAPRCRLYRTREGLRGLPERRWIEDALRS
ncbi:MAG: hypothetical protein H0U86_05340 [Chloroflexi bacterium]|nr:hypothetical protein [Chloroflexota bacterium]